MNKPAKLPTVEQALNEMDASNTLHGAMALAFAEIEGATKAALNPHFGKKYADISAVIDAIKPALIKHRLFFTQRNQPHQEGVVVETVLHHANGDEMPLGALFVPADQRNAQKYGSALTYARRYALMTAFGVPAEDDDGNAAVAAMEEPKREIAAISAADVKLIEELAPKAERTIQQLCEAYNISELSELTAEKGAACIKRLKELAKVSA